MIRSFKDREVEKIFNRVRSRKLPVDLQRTALRKLRMLNRAINLNDLRVPPSNRLEKMKGDRADQYSIRINNQWRICFNWSGNDAFEVEIVDYHRGYIIMGSKKLSPLHPGEILQKEFLEPIGLSQNKLAMALHVPARRINEIVLGKRGVTADTALRLSRYFGMSPQFWLGLQMDYELDVAEDLLEDRIEKEVTPMDVTG